MPRFVALVVLAVLGACQRAAPPPQVPRRPAVQPGAHVRPHRVGAPTADDLLPANAVTAALQEGHVCFDLPGAPRTRLLPAAGGHLLYAVELATELTPATWHLRAVDLDTRTATVVLRDVDPDPVVVGEQVVFRRQTAEQDGPRRGMLLAAIPGRTEPQLLTPPEHDVASFAVLPAGDAVVYLSRHDAAEPSLWRVPLQGELRLGSLGPALALWQAVEAGLVVRGVAAEGLSTLLLPTEGPPRHLGPDGRAVVHAGAGLLLEDHRGGLWRLAPPSAEPLPVPGSEPGDALVAGADHAWVVRHEPTQDRLFQFDGEQLQPMATVAGPRWQAVARLPGSVVAGLLQHDTDQDGAWTAEDEADVCVVALAVEPVAVPVRTVPRQYVAALPALQQATAAAGLTRARLRFLQHGKRLRVDVEGTTPAPEAALALVKGLHPAVIRATGKPQLEVEVRWLDADVAAHAVWSEALERPRFEARIADLVLSDRTDFGLEVDATARKGGPGDGCEGTVRQTGATPVALQGRCDVYDEGVGPVATRRLRLEATGQDGTSRFSAPAGSGAPTGRTRVRFEASGDPVPHFDLHLARDAADWAGVLRELRRRGGITVRPPPEEPGARRPAAHEMTMFQVDAAFPSRPAREQQAIAKALWRAVEQHRAGYHRGGAMGELRLHGEGGRVWRVDRDGVAEVEGP